MRSKTGAATVALAETLRLALDTLRAHKLRSFLTLLGVILAVTTLVAVMSVVAGLNLYISDKVANLGANVFVVDRFGIITSWEAWLKAQRRPVIRPEEYEALAEEMRQAQQVAALEGGISDIRFGNDLIEDVNIVGVTPNYAEVRSYSVAAGRFFNETDEQHRSPVCFVGADVARRFFSTRDPIGKSIRVGSETYDVVGVAKAIGSVFGQSQDNFLLIPLGTYRKTRHAPNGSLTLFVQARHAEMLEAAEDEARLLLRARRHLAWSELDNFGIVGSKSITGLWEQLTGNIFQLAVWLTSVFLVVGGIVIMNIMLASVTERTREIGIRRSLGARRRHIVMQFLAESAVLAAIGGLMGILTALGIGVVVRGTLSFPFTTHWNAVLTALALSTGVGLFFGIYPAVRAARLDPIEALRAEG